MRTRVEESNLWGSSPPPRFSGPVADHSAALSNCVPSGSRTPFSGLKVRHPSPRRPMGRCDPAGSRTRSCALRGRRHFRVVHRAWCWSTSRPASRPRLCAASVWAAGIEPAWTWFRARWPAIDPHPVVACGVTGGDRTRTSSFTARRALQYTTATVSLPELESNQHHRLQRPAHDLRSGKMSELRESNPRLRFVGPRPCHWTKLRALSPITASA